MEWSKGYSLQYSQFTHRIHKERSGNPRGLLALSGELGERVFGRVVYRRGGSRGGERSVRVSEPLARQIAPAQTCFGFGGCAPKRRDMAEPVDTGTLPGNLRCNKPNQEIMFPPK